MPTLRTQLVLDDMKHLKDEFVMLVYTAATIVCTSLTGCWSLDVARWDNLSVSIAEGDTVTLTCRSPTPERRTRGSLGLVQGEDRGVGMVPLWDSGLQGEAVNRRYRITYRVSGPKSVLRLTIRDARREDSGSYGCLLNSDERTASYMTLNVLEGPRLPERGSPGPIMLEQGTAGPRLLDHGRGQVRHKRDYGWSDDYDYEYGWTIAGTGLDQKWLTLCLPAVIVGLLLLLLVCMIEKWRKRIARAINRPSGAVNSPRTNTYPMLDTTYSQPRTPATTPTVPTPRSRSQQRQEDYRIIARRLAALRQATARCPRYQDAYLLTARMTTVGPESEVILEGPRCPCEEDDEGPPPYAEALDSSVYPPVTNHSERSAGRDLPPPYSSLEGVITQDR